MIDFNLQDVRLGDPESAVLEKLGNPLNRRKAKVDKCSIEEVVILKYPGMEIELDRDSEGQLFVLEIAVNSPGAEIYPGVKVGDTIENVRSKLGEPYAQPKMPDEMNLHYITRGDDNASLQFRGNKLSKVRLYINPC